MTVSTIDGDTFRTATLRDSRSKANTMVASIDLPTPSITKGTTIYFQFVLMDLVANNARGVLCPWSSTTTNVTCPDVADEGPRCVEQGCTFPVPAAGTYPASTYEVDMLICLSTVGASDCAAVEETFGFQFASSFNNSGVWAGSWGSTAPAVSAAAPNATTSASAKSTGPTISAATALNPATKSTPSATSTSGASSANSSASSSSSSPSTMIIIIAIAAGVVVVGAFFAAFYIYRRSTRSRAASASKGPAVPTSSPYTPPPPPSASAAGPIPDPNAGFYQAPAQSSMMAMSPTHGSYGQQPFAPQQIQHHPQQPYAIQQSYTLESSAAAGPSDLPTMQAPNFAPHPNINQHYVGGGSEYSFPGQHHHLQQGAQSSMMSYTSAGSSSAPLHHGSMAGSMMTEAVAPAGALSDQATQGGSEKQGGLWYPPPQATPSLPRYEHSPE
ncbi:hypothetical protein HK101_002664 [Irineochytrium annulatum]|nr:hypothetical protein HK101_002664 [Irineochytrium annulatum]